MSEVQEVFKRVEIKYILSDEQYKALRKRLEGRFEVDQYGETDILNIYYDTPDFKLVRTSIEKPEYKEKLRLRTYGIPKDGSEKAFVEIKKKFKGIVYKRRVSVPLLEAEAFLNEGSALKKESQIQRELDAFLKQYPGIGPRMAISYKRIAMAGVEDPNLRITFDTHIRWRVGDLDLREGAKGEEILKPGQHLMEVKILNAFPLELARIFSELGIFQTSISKYGEGYRALVREQLEMAQSKASENAYGTISKKDLSAIAVMQLFRGEFQEGIETAEAIG